MFCKRCNNKLNEGDLFCGNCGTKVELSTNLAPNSNEQTSANNIPYQRAMSSSFIDNLNNEINNINANQTNQLNSMNEQVATNSNTNYPQFYNQEQFHTENTAINNNFNFQNRNERRSWKNTTSLIIGIISLVAVFIFQVFTMPLSIVGIVFGVLSFKENKKNKVGLILNIISLVIAIPVFMLYASILESRPANPAIGTWDCKAFNNGYNEDLDYIITMKLNNDNQFKWNKYNDEKNNYVIGTYDFVDLHKTNNNGTANYYSITLTGDEFVNDGELQSAPYRSEYEMGIIKDADEAILMNVQTYNMYYCYRSDKSSPKVEGTYSNDYDKNKENNIRVKRLTYSLPSNLTEGSMNTDTYKSYSYMNTNSFCQFKVTTYELYDSMTTQEYFEDYVYDEEKDLSKIYTKNLNGTEWHMLEVDGQYSKMKYGVYIDDQNVYGIEFSIIDDSNNECEKLYNNITESMKIN